MKRKREICHALEFAKQVKIDKPWIRDLKACDKMFEAKQARIDKPWIRDLKACDKMFEWSAEVTNGKKHVDKACEAMALSRTVFTVNQWLQSKQCYSITGALAEDLFTMDDLTFPIDALHLPFPCFYLDMEPFSEDFTDVPGAKLLGYYVLVNEVPCGEGMIACFCSIIILALDTDGEYVFGGTSFDYAPEHMKDDLNNTVHMLSCGKPEQRKHIARALLFAAYLSSEKPEVTEDEAQKQFYRPSEKPKYSSVRKWDVGVRYMLEKQRYAQRPALSTGTNEESSAATGDGTDTADRRPKRNSPRPHMRKAHWKTYRTGRGRTGRKVLWIPPGIVAMPKDGKSEEIPVVIRAKKEKDNEKKT